MARRWTRTDPILHPIQQTYFPANLPTSHAAISEVAPAFGSENVNYSHRVLSRRSVISDEYSDRWLSEDFISRQVGFPTLFWSDASF